MKTKLKQFLSDIDENILVADGLDNAFVGLANTKDGIVAVYQIDLVVVELMEDKGMTIDEAEEYIDFKISSAYVGPRTPLFLNYIPKEFWKDFSIEDIQ